MIDFTRLPPLSPALKAVFSAEAARITMLRGLTGMAPAYEAALRHWVSSSPTIEVARWLTERQESAPFVPYPGIGPVEFNIEPLELSGDFYDALAKALIEGGYLPNAED